MTRFCEILTAVLVAMGSAQAGLTFEATELDVQADLDQRVAPCEFRFENRGDQAVRIARYESSCACLAVQVANGKRDYAPGESGIIRAVFDLGNATGKVEKVVQLWLDDDPISQPSILLKARLHIPELVQIEPKTLHWEVDADGQPQPQTLTVNIDHDEPIHVQQVDASGEGFEVKLRELEVGRSYAVDVVPKTLTAPALSVIYLRTDAKLERFRLQRAFAVVRKPLDR